MKIRRLATLCVSLGTVFVVSGCSSGRSEPEYGEYRSRQTASNILTAEQIQHSQSANTVEELLVRLVPAVHFTRSGLRIRGHTGAPLWVLDGVPLAVGAGGVPVNPRDVERIEVLRDGGATAAYGFRGGNGVIVIRTKR